jgi:hypothetical protein
MNAFNRGNKETYSERIDRAKIAVFLYDAYSTWKCLSSIEISETSLVFRL